MKYLSISIICLIPFSLFANELQWVDEQIQAIKPSRSSITKSQINSIKSPFVFLIKKTKKIEKNSPLPTQSKTADTSTVKKNSITKKTTSLVLTAIINKSALINDRWYRLDTKIGKYTLSKVNRTSVVLTYKKKELLLSTRTVVKKLKFKNN